VVVWKLDRLGRNTRSLLALIDDLEHRGVHFRSITEGISTIGPMGRAMLTVMSAFAQLERDQLAEHKGRHGGGRKAWVEGRQTVPRSPIRQLLGSCWNKFRCRDLQALR
jgi:hypothetical protein